MNPSVSLARPGDIAVGPFPFTDLTGSKRRPVLILAVVNRDDCVVAFITSRPQPDGFDNILISSDDPEFAQTRLVTASTIRLGRLATLHSSVFLGRLGRIGPSTQARVSEGLRLLFP
ncbi:MAG: type II toxin-antitoxin system PemK/MazF family toxin [bacterium]